MVQTSFFGKTDTPLFNLNLNLLISQGSGENYAVRLGCTDWYSM